MSSKTIKSSILKVSNKSATERLNETLARTKSKVQFMLPSSKKLVNILQNVLDGSDIKEYERLLGALLNADLDDDDLLRILQESTQLISILTQDVRLFVEALLSIKWTNRSESIITEYRSFVLNLLSAHNYYAKYAIDVLVSNFLPGMYFE